MLLEKKRQLCLKERLFLLLGSEYPVFPFPLPSLTLFPIIESFKSIGVNLLLKNVPSIAYFWICFSFPYFPHGHFHDHLGDQNCLICTLVRLIASRKPLGEAWIVGVAIILKLVKYHTIDEIYGVYRPKWLPEKWPGLFVREPWRFWTDTYRILQDRLL